MKIFGFLFHKNSGYIWIALAGGFIGFALGRTQDPLDRAIRKAQNEAKPVIQTTLRDSSRNLFSNNDVFTIDEQLSADPAKREAYARTVSNNMAKKENAIQILNDSRAYIDLALKNNFIDNSLQQYLSTLGDLQLRHGFLYLAVTNLEKAIFINPFDARSIYNLAMSYLGLYQVLPNNAEKSDTADKAVSTLNIGLALSPDQVDLLYGLALIYTDRGAYSRALPLFSRLLELNPANIDALMGAGRIYYELKEYDKSRQIFEKAEALILNQKNSGSRFIKYSPERKLTTVRNNLQTLYNILGTK